MDKLASYSSDEDAENSQKSPPKRLKTEHSSTKAAQIDLAAEWESFEKLIAGDVETEANSSALQADQPVISIPAAPAAPIGVPSPVVQPAVASKASVEEASSDPSSRNKDGSNKMEAEKQKRIRMHSGSSSESEESEDSDDDSSSEEETSENSESETEDVKSLQKIRKEKGLSSSADSDSEESSAESSESSSGEEEEEKKSAPIIVKEPSPIIIRSSKSPPKRSSLVIDKHSQSKSKRSRSRSPSGKHSRSQERKSGGSLRGRHRSSPDRKHRGHTRRHRPHRSRSRDRRKRSRSRSNSRRKRSRSRDRRKRRSSHWSPSHNRSRHSHRRGSPTSKKHLNKKPISYKEALRQKLIEAQKQAAEGKLEFDPMGLHNLMSPSEKPSPLPLMSINPLMSLATGPPGGDKVTPQQALMQTMAAMHQKAQQLTGVAVPKYYNPAAVNPVKYAEQIKKRKLLWSKKDQNSEGETSEVPFTVTTEHSQSAVPETISKPGGENSQWKSGTSFIEDQDGKMEAKFRKLMGIKGSEASKSVDDPSSSENIKKQQELFNQLDKEYQFARMTTHTHRGIGLGFTSQMYPDGK